MKDVLNSAAVGRALDPAAEDFGNRKLIRPTLTRPERPEHMRPERPEPRADRGDRGDRGSKKSPPPDQTHAENFYYQKQMQSHTPMVVVLDDGEQLRGVIEWYDRDCIKLNRTGQPNLLVYKTSIRYMYKESEGDGRR